MMKATVFFKKIFSPMLWLNFIAMALMVVALCFGVKFGIEFYTHHGEKVRVPNIRNRSFADAERILEDAGLKIEISDTGYVKALPPDCILEQSILAGYVVKPGRVVRVVINASSTPTLTIPDVIDNSSYRAAKAKLEAMGFRLGEPEYVSGEKGWVYGIKVKGKLVGNGQRVPIDALLILQVGSGYQSMTDSLYFMEDEVEVEETMPGDTLSQEVEIIEIDENELSTESPMEETDEAIGEPLE